MHVKGPQDMEKSDRDRHTEDRGPSSKARNKIHKREKEKSGAVRNEMSMNQK